MEVRRVSFCGCDPQPCPYAAVAICNQSPPKGARDLHVAQGGRDGPSHSAVAYGILGARLDPDRVVRTTE